MKVRRPRNRGGVRGRKRGTKVRYNAYQTQRYQSIWLRTERARRLQPPLQLEAGVFQFRSKRKRVKPYRTTTRDGSLAPITSFTGTPTRSGKPPDCLLPATSYLYLNPLFRWMADGIHDCSKDNPGGGGGTTDPPVPKLPPEPWQPVPSGQTRRVTVTVAVSATVTARAPGCSTSDSTSNTSTATFLLNSETIIRTELFAGSNEGIQGTCNGESAGGTLTQITALFTITGFLNLTLSSATTFIGNPGNLLTADVYNTQTQRAVVTLNFDDPPNLPPPGYTPQPDGGYQLAPPEGGYTPSSMLSDLATAGIEAESNTFQVPERLDIFTSIAYSIASKMPASSGLISLKLFTDGAQTNQLAETPTASTGSLNVPMTLLPAHDYQFKISIPESIYCDAAIVRLGGKFICNCPDFNRKSKAFPSKFPSELGDRDWSASSAGTRKDCKHIIYLKLQTGEGIDAEPDDLKDIRQWKQDQTARTRQQRKRERQAEAQSRKDALKRVKADLRGMRQRDKAEVQAVRDQLKAARTSANRKPRKRLMKPRKYRGEVYTGDG